MRFLTRQVLREWLENEMSQVSRNYNGTDWFYGLEYHLWDAVLSYPQTRDYLLDLPRLLKLKDVADETDTWIVSESGQRKAVSLDQWRKMYDEWMRDNYPDYYEDAEAGEEELDGSEAVDIVRRIAGLMNSVIGLESVAEGSGSKLSLSLEEFGGSRELLRVLDDCRDIAMDSET